MSKPAWWRLRQSQAVAILQLGPADADHLRLEILGRSYPQATDYDDGNWLSCRFDLRAGHWKGHWYPSVRAEEIAAFRDQVATLSREVAGEAVFETMEQWLSLTLRMDRLGHLAVAGKARVVVGTGNVLAFRFHDLDQTFLPDFVTQLDKAIHAFPVVSIPNA